MFTLLKLNRNVSMSEQKEMVRKLRKAGYKVQPDPWAIEKRILVEGHFGKQMHGIGAIVEFILLDAPTKTLNEVVELIKQVVVDNNLKEFSIKGKVFPGTPFHMRAIQERVKSKIKFTKSDKNIIYVETKPKGDHVLVRVGFVKGSTQVGMPDIALVLESPKTPYEVADFIRLGISLKLPVHIVTDKDVRTMHAVADAKKIMKGYNKAELKMFNTTKEAVKGRTPISFSLWGKKTESDLKVLEGPLAFIFGNEERGVKIDTQNFSKLVVRLGPASSEPMRASQAAAFAIGFMLR